MRSLKAWFKNRSDKDMMRRNPGLAEKEAATQKKLDVAMRILNRRKEELPVETERRHEDDYKGFLKPAT